MKTLLFDLDGTLLPMDLEAFTSRYLSLLARKAATAGLTDSQKLISTIWHSVEAMGTSGDTLNEDAFWSYFESVFPETRSVCLPLFEQFYRSEFHQAADTCGRSPQAARLLELAREKGWKVILATNPIFPAVATEARIGWAGLKPADFDYISTYENSHFCKPDVRYFQELIETCDLDPGQCLMIGNDTTEDTPALQTGMDFFLVTDCLLNARGDDLEQYHHGSMDDLMNWLNQDVA